MRDDADVTEPTLSILKTLFARSWNACAFQDPDTGVGCEERLTDPTWPRVKARVCHIRGHRPGSARYDPTVSERECNAYPNLLLLCPNHHVQIDDLEPERFPPHVLEEMKERHEFHGSGPAGAWASDEYLGVIARMLAATYRSPLIIGRVTSDTAPARDSATGGIELRAEARIE